MRPFFYLSVIAFLLSGCTTIELAADLAKKLHKRDQTPAAEAGAAKGVVAAPRYKIGNPYEVAGVWYYPERNLSYDQTGIASWYGDEFGGRLTANGEIFDPDIVSAAHKTLPMPSAVRVTNLDNGRSMVIRINDRGPFVSGRIIDLSREAARLLGFQQKGIAKVRVQLLAEESLRLEREAKEGRFPSIGVSENTPKPKINAAPAPKVSLTSTNRSGAVIEKKNDTISAIDLITSSRSTDVIELAPVDTRIWVQVGAFSEIGNAEAMATKLRGVGTIDISSFDNNGAVIHRVRVGPMEEVADADATLARIFDLGYNGARIVLE